SGVSGRQRHEHAAVRIVLAALCVAGDLGDVAALECLRDESRPHRAVELGQARLRPNEWAEWAGRGSDHRVLVRDLGDGSLIAETAERGARASHRRAEVLRRTDSRLAGELSTERGADRANAIAARALGQGIDDKPDQLLIATLRELDRGELRRDSIGLCRPPGTGARASGPALERGNQQARLCKPLESATGDVAVYLLPAGELVGGYRGLPRTGE